MAGNGVEVQMVTCVWVIWFSSSFMLFLVNISCEVVTCVNVVGFASDQL